MIIFLYGSDNFSSLRKLNEIVAQCQKAQKNGTSLKLFEGKSLKYEDFQEEFQSASLFSKKKLIVLKNVISSKDFGESLLKNSKRISDSKDIVVIYEEGEIPKGKLADFLKKNAKSQEFRMMEGQKLKDWVKSEFKKYSQEIDNTLVEKLINLVGNDLWQLSNEINKLSFFKRGLKIEPGDIDILVKPKIEGDIFKTIDAVATRDKKQAFRLIRRHLENGESALYILSMITFQMRNILIVKEMVEKNKPYQDIIYKAKLHPFVVRKSYYQSQRFTFQELKKIYQKIFQADVNIKTGKLEPEEALNLLISEI